MMGEVHNGLRRAHRMVRKPPHYHVMKRFQQTKDSKVEDTQWGPEYFAECRYCGAYILVYFDDKDSLERQGYKPEDHIKLESDVFGFHSVCYMVVSGNWDRFECGELRKGK